MASRRRTPSSELKPFKHLNGSLAASVSFTLGGKRKKKFVYGSDILEVSRKHAAAMLEAGIVPDGRLEFGTWLEKYVQYRAPELAESTLINYRSYLSRALPAMGAIKLEELNQFVFLAFFESQADIGQSTKQHLFDFLHSAVKDAVNLDVIPKNPMRGMRRPKIKAPMDAGTWTPEEVRALLKAFKGHRLEVLPFVCFSLGLRIGEVLALRWQDVHSDKLEINRTLNNCYVEGAEPFRPCKAGSLRALSLDSETLAMINAHRSRQYLEKTQAENSSTFNPLELVFCSSRGSLLNLRNIRRLFDAFIAKAGVKRYATHSMRKTYASLAAAVLPITDVQARLGHSDPRMTLRVYAKSYTARNKAAAIPLSKLLDLGLTSEGEK